MAKATKRPNKAAKAAKKMLENSELLANKADPGSSRNIDRPTAESNPRTSSAIKPRPDKKRG